MSEIGTAGSLFAGIGGMDLGFERQGFSIKWQVEIDKFATKVLEKNWPNVERHKDILDFPPKDGIDRSVSVILAGFPCQDISKSGKGGGLEEERSGLFYEAIRVARELRPRAIVLENVPALTVRWLGDVLRALAEIGYDAEWHCIPASAFNAPHVRDRIFIIATLADPNSERGRSGNPERKDAKDAWKPPRCKKLGIWDVEPSVGRVANGVPNRIHRNRCLGNAVVPQVAEHVAKILKAKMKHVGADV